MGILLVFLVRREGAESGAGGQVTFVMAAFFVIANGVTPRPERASIVRNIKQESA